MFVHRRSLKRGLVYEEWIHFLTKKRLYTWMNENEEISQVLVVAGYHVCCSQHIAKLSTMTQDAMVYKVSSCFFFYYGGFFLFLIVAQLELS